ncbi:MAG: aspartate/glutamate racemase family protein [Thiolinea sp.]
MEASSPGNVRLSAVQPRYQAADAVTRLGLLALSSDLTSERDYARVLPADTVAFYTSRVPFDNPTTPESLAKMAPRLTQAARLLPDDQPLAAICYSCTAASVVIGDQLRSDAVQQVWPGVPVVLPSSSAVLALQALGAQRISVVTPYTQATSEPMADYFQTQGLDIRCFECLGVENDWMMARITPESIIEAACQADRPDSEALFLSCTALPALGVIAELEQRLGKPVVSSNQATLWAMLQHSGIDYQPQGYGQLFQHALPTLVQE